MFFRVRFGSSLRFVRHVRHTVPDNFRRTAPEGNCNQPKLFLVFCVSIFGVNFKCNFRSIDVHWLWKCSIDMWWSLPPWARCLFDIIIIVRFTCNAICAGHATTSAVHYARTTRWLIGRTLSITMNIAQIDIPRTTIDIPWARKSAWPRPGKGPKVLLWAPRPGRALLAMSNEPRTE